MRTRNSSLELSHKSAHENAHRRVLTRKCPRRFTFSLPNPLPSSPHRAMQVCDAMCFCKTRCESCDVRALDGTETSDLCSAMCIAESTFAMRCIFTAICTLIAEIHCDVGRDVSTSNFQSEVGEVFGEIGGELPAKSGRRFSSFFCWGNRQKHFPPKLHRKVHHQTSLCGSGLWRALAMGASLRGRCRDVVNLDPLWHPEVTWALLLARLANRLWF